MDSDTFVGIWINWDFGRVLGLTLTVPKFYGTILIATLALIVKWAGSRLWGVICFIVHYSQTNRRSHDGLHYQHQALLRSKLPETDFLWRLYEISWAWRSNAPKAFQRSSFLGTLALVNLAAFIVAGIFSARVTVAESKGLITGLCGEIVSVADKDFLEWTKEDWAAGDALFVSAYNGYRDLLQYVQLCYAAPFFTGTDLRCRVPEVPRIKSTFNRDASCPFAQGVCKGPAIAMDSGLVNADSHIGINLAPSDNIQVRKLSTCAPLAMDDYSSGWTYQLEPGAEAFLGVPTPGDQYKYYSLGPSVRLSAPISNFTFLVSNFTLGTPGLPYTFNIRSSYARNLSESGFIPDPALNRTDADVSILTLNNRVAYTGQVDDPFFQATLPIGGNGLSDTYFSNSTLTGIACIEQYQFCNPSLPGDAAAKCSPLGAIYDFDEHKPPETLKLNARQQAAYRILRLHLYYLRFGSFVEFLKNEILVATKLIWGSFGLSTPLSSTQWQTEVENFHNITLAGLQLQQIYFAAVPDTEVRPGLALHDYIVPRTDPDEQYVCRNQRIHLTRFSSFNMFGIFIILCVSFVIIFLDIFLPAIVRWLPTVYKKKEISLDAWQEDDILQIQRTALESQGVGPWTDMKGSVPVTAGWDLRFRRGRSQAKDRDSQLFDGLERLTGSENEGDIELSKVPMSNVTRL